MARSILCIFGTRPEAIKLAPVIQALQSDPGFRVTLVSTGQHRDLVRQTLAFFGLRPDHDLDLMQHSQSLAGFAARALDRLAPLIQAERPDLVVVQGDTGTSLCGALAAHYAQRPVAHIEAGLRSGSLAAPWPEEANRRMVAVLADRHFAPTDRARRALLSENVPAERVHVTGNTVIDALIWARDRLSADKDLATALDARFAFLRADRPLILVTGHRRENFGAGIRNLCTALRRLAALGSCQIVFVVHANPAVRDPVGMQLRGLANLHLIDALDYPGFVYLMQRCRFILTDSGGIQEEAPSLGKPVLVLRQTTERPEAVQAGTARLVGTEPDAIVAAVQRLIDNPSELDAISRIHNPFGDGQASRRIVRLLALFPD